MNLKAVGQLSGYVVKAVGQWMEETWKTLSDLWKYTTLEDVSKVCKDSIHLEKELSADEAIKVPGAILKNLFDSMNKTKVPAWALYPVLWIITAVSGLKTILQVSDVTSERNILQPLRKNIRPALLDAGSAIQAELRGQMKAEEVDDVLQRYGYTKEAIKSMRSLAQFIPGASDIVLFALREAYDDGVAGTFKTDDNLSSVLAATEKDRKAAGLSDELFKRYWRSHWDLPGISQGFEMFQRGQLSRGDLETLLRVKDIMPFFRDKLLNISYNLLTRVDVRRMHKLKLINDSDLAKEYQRMGHSPEDAEKLAKFTVAYNKSPEAQDKTDEDANKTKERDLTKAEILDALDGKLIDADKTKTLLGALGYSTEEIELLLARQNHKEEMDTLTALLKAYKDLYIKGLADKADIQKELQAIPLPAENIAKLFTMWDLEAFSKMDNPTKAEAIAWYKKKWISRAEAERLLQNVGTQSQFIDLYLREK
jgi:hypothetical protein